MEVFWPREGEISPEMARENKNNKEWQHTAVGSPSQFTKQFQSHYLLSSSQQPEEEHTPDLMVISAIMDEAPTGL